MHQKAHQQHRLSHERRCQSLARFQPVAHAQASQLRDKLPLARLLYTLADAIDERISQTSSLWRTQQRFGGTSRTRWWLKLASNQQPVRLVTRHSQGRPTWARLAQQFGGAARLCYAYESSYLIPNASKLQTWQGSPLDSRESAPWWSFKGTGRASRTVS